MLDLFASCEATRDCSRASDRAAAHVPLPVITMSKSPVFGTKNHYLTDGTPFARKHPQSAWARCIGGVFPPVNRKKRPEIRIFWGRTGWTRRRLFAGATKNASSRASNH